MRGLAVGAVLGVLASAVSVGLVSVIWRSCDIGVNAAAGSFALMIGGALMWLIVVSGWVVLFVVVGRWSVVLAIGLGLVGTVLVVWVAVTGFGILESYPDPVCPRNVPPWWPRAVPTGW